MSALDTARTIAGPIGDVGARFMLSPRTYARGAELGFSDIDFYFCGRGGVLPDVDGDLVVEEFGFFEPTAARAKFDQGRAVMEPARAAEVFIHIGYDWGRARLPEQLDAARLTELVRTVLEAAVAVPNGASDDAPEAEPHRAAWQRAEVATDEATARLLDVLDAAERAELARLVLAAVPV